MRVSNVQSINDGGALLSRWRPCFGAFVYVLLTACAGTAQAAASQSENLGVFKDWTAVRFSEGGADTCMMWSQPQHSEGKYTRRGEVYVFVTHRPSAKSFDSVSFESGYTFKPKSEVDVQVKADRFHLSTEGSMAWTGANSDGKKLVAAMRAGREMVTKGVSSRGTLTEDRYSLYGFSAAYRAIGRACGRR